jgi:hypothetical protein
MGASRITDVHSIFASGNLKVIVPFLTQYRICYMTIS